jgi:phosphoenolpyruvate carboxykinase (GTP)
LKEKTDVIDSPTAATGTLQAPTDHEGILAWVAEVAELTAPADIVFCDGSRAEWHRLTGLLVEQGTFVPLTAKPNSFWCVSDPEDVARVEDRTFICSEHPDDAGPTNNWVDPLDMRTVMTEHYRGSMAGRTMYVIAFCMGPLDAADPKFGVQLTDSAYVAASMRIMTRSGAAVWKQLTDGTEFVKCLHSVGAPLADGQVDVPWPCDQIKYISHFPESRTVWSYGSGYGGNALLGKKCFALRIASVLGRDEGWLAEHMLILKLTSPQGKTHYVAAAFPSSCGKTNLAMLEPALPGWTAETIGDDIAWLRPGADGRLYAVNPEAGFFGVAPGTGAKTNPNAIATIEVGNSIFTNTARTLTGDVWWEGLTASTPATLIDWRGNEWTPESGTPAAHPNSRYCTPIEQCPSVAPEWNDPTGVPLSAIFFGGRRASTVPLVTESFDWQHGVFTASVLSSETTAAAAGAVGVVRRDPMAMLPFLGYHVGDYFEHWLSMAERPGARLPKIFQVNWFRRSADGTFLWPGFGDNVRVLKWALQRLDGTADAVQTPIGYVPTADALDLTGLSGADRELVAQALAVDTGEWEAETASIDEWYATLGGNRLPGALREQLAALKLRLAQPR